MKLRSGKIIDTSSVKSVKKNYRSKSCLSELITFSIISCSIILFSIITHQDGLWNNMQENFEEYYQNTINPFTFNTFDIMNITSQEFIPRALLSNLF